MVFAARAERLPDEQYRTTYASLSGAEPSMRDSRWPRGTCTAPGRCDSSNSCCSRTSTITAPLALPLLDWTRSWTSFGSTSLILSLTLRMSSAPLGIVRNSLNPVAYYFNKCSAPAGDLQSTSALLRSSMVGPHLYPRGE